MASIQVAMRCRPFVGPGDLGVELRQTGDGPAGGEVNILNSNYTKTRYGFAYAWWSAHNHSKYAEKDKHIASDMKFITQDLAYEACGLKIKKDLLSGSAVVMFAYGLSGSGKTFTVFGPDAADSPDAWFKHAEPNDMWGILPRLAYSIFNEKTDEWKITVKYFQNVVDTVRDLTSPSASEQQYKAGMRKDQDGFMDINWCGKVVVNTWDELRTMFQQCNARKAISPTQFNHQSTRGHCVMTLEVEKPDADAPAMKQRGRLYVCDLAGTEPAGDIFYAEYKKVPQDDGSVEYQLIGPHSNQAKTKELQDQGKKINLSLSEMAQFFMKMAAAFKKGELKAGGSIPGCNSYFLCKYLKDTMMQAKTYLFCAIRPETKFHQYTYATLGFANNASVIKLDPKKATAAASELERKLMKELDEMRELVATLRAQLAEGGGGGGDAKETAAAVEQVATLQRQVTVKIQEIQQEADPSAAAATDAYEKQKAHLQARGITLSSEVEDLGSLNTPYLINLDEDPFRSGRMLCILEKTPTSFGREKNDVRPQSMSMVADHCFFDGSGVTRSIKGGKGAAYVNGAVVKSGKTQELKDGDRVIIGAELYVFRAPGSIAEIDEDAAFEEYRLALLSNSEYKGQFKQAASRLRVGGKSVTIDKKSAEQLEQEMMALYPKAAEVENLCTMLDREYIDTSVVLQSTKVTSASKEDAKVVVKVVNRNSNPVETIYLPAFEFNRAYKILSDELYHLRDAIGAEEQYVVPFQHDPLMLLFDSTFHVGTAVMFPEYLVYNLETDDSERLCEVFPAAASGAQNMDAGKLDVVWVPLPGPEGAGGQVADIVDETDLLGKPWTYRCTIKQALQLPMICDLCYCEYEFFDGYGYNTHATETVDFSSRPTRSPVLDYEYEHHVECVTEEFLAWLKKPLEIKIFISLDVKRPAQLAGTDNQKVVDLIRADMKLPAQRVKADVGAADALAEAMERIQSLTDKVDWLMNENEKVKKVNKQLVMQRRVALSVAMEASKKSFPDTGMEAAKAEKAGKPPPKPSAREAAPAKKKGGSSACVVS